MTEARAIAIQPDNKIVIAGTDGGAMAIFRLTDEGNFDVDGFNANAVKPQLKGRYVYLEAPGWAYAVALQGTGIVVAGKRGVMRDDGTGDQDGAVWRFTMDGLLDLGFGSSAVVTTGFDHTYDVFQAMALDASDRIVVTGSKNEGGNLPVSAMVARYNVDGILDWGFNGGASVVVHQAGWAAHYPYALAIDRSGNILIGESAAKRDAGNATVAAGAGLWRLSPQGNWTPRSGRAAGFRFAPRQRPERVVECPVGAERREGHRRRQVLVGSPLPGPIRFWQ